MSSLLETLTQQLGGNMMGQIGQLLGTTDQEKAGEATGAAVTTLLGALARNASDKNGAESLHRALAKDHDGSALQNLAGLMNNPQSGPGEGILRHVLGSKRQAVEAGLGRQTGLDSQAVSKLLTALAPAVMGALGQTQRQSNLDAGGLAGMLGQQRQQIEREQPQAMGFVGKMLDTDGDGDFDMSDMAKHGMGMLGKLFKR